MSDIKNVLSLLCQHLNISINIVMKPEYFRLAKFNSTDENVNGVFWKALNILSYYAVKENNAEIDFQQCDIVWSTKLYFAYLKYSTIEFYSLNEHSKNNRQLLLAFAWILGTQNILSIITWINLSNSVLGRECSYLKNSLDNKETEYNVPETLIAQISNILYLNGKVNYNIKAISELISERSKLVSKVHDASIKVSGLPHLSVSEAALIKRIAIANKNEISNEDRKYIKELSTIANLLDLHMKWLKKEHVFFEWMVTVVEEHKISLSVSLEDINWNEVSKFISLLQCLTQERLEALLSKKESKDSQDYKPNFISRLLRAQDNDTEMENWLSEISVELNKKTENLSQRKEKLSKELAQVLQSIPSCVQVSFS
ncbi:uncharacterized protein LOC143424244 isoform X2 [Xylocopa sonorina]|uniref:uncharacterized protein LOC143424244 isoform X2 n=1 Tax=Xylocopa sonorina TaxID=1818115 RepID=UPI00403B2246